MKKKKQTDNFTWARPDEYSKSLEYRKTENFLKAVLLAQKSCFFCVKGGWMHMGKTPNYN